MQIRKTVLEDLDMILDIYSEAKKFMSVTGNPHQWDDNYPNKELLQEDIRLSQSFVCTENDEIVGTFCFYLGEDSCYQTIYHGSWLNDQPYGVIHRIATNNSKYGIGKFCINFCKKQCQNIRIDTHKDNVVMQNFLKKHNFCDCGMIHLENGESYLAYHYYNKEI